jgi:hypothetical protein
LLFLFAVYILLCDFLQYGNGSLSTHHHHFPKEAVVVVDGIIREIVDPWWVDIHILWVVVQDVVYQLMTICLDSFWLLFIDIRDINLWLLGFKLHIGWEWKK